MSEKRGREAEGEGEGERKRVGLAMGEARLLPCFVVSYPTPGWV